MDDLDVLILRELGMEPFIAWPRRHVGHRTSEIARKLGRNVQFVNDRVARMEADGVLTGYRLFPNLRHWGTGFSVLHWAPGFVPDRERLSKLSAVDGFSAVIWCLDSSLCLDLAHAGPAQRDRRVELIQKLLGTTTTPQTFYERTFPTVERRLSALDWRIIHALEKDARRPLSDVAEELGVTAKTVRSRFNAMWEEGSIDAYVTLDFAKMSGMILFQMAIWVEEGSTGVEARVLDHFRDRLLASFRPPADGYSSFLIRIFAYTPAEVQALVREVMEIDGVRSAEPSLATGAYYNEAWLVELMEGQMERLPVALP